MARVTRRHSLTEDERRYEALCTALRLCRAMANRPQSLYQLAKSVEKCPRTIRRVITTLRRAGVDIRKHRREDDPAFRYSLDRVTWQGLLDLPVD